MRSETASLMQRTIDALASMDAGRLEGLSAEAATIYASAATLNPEDMFELQTLRQSLDELLRSTSGNLRVLTSLRGLRAQDDCEVSRWAR